MLNTEVENARRTLHKTYVCDAVNGKITTVLKRDKLEGQINNGPETSADEILKTLDQIYDEAINAENTVPISEEMDDYAPIPASTWTPRDGSSRRCRHASRDCPLGP